MEHHRELVQGQHNDEVFRHNRQQGKPNLIQVWKGTIFKNQIVFPDFLQNPALISSSAAAAAAAAAAAVVVNHATGVVEAGGSWINEGKRLLLWMTLKTYSMFPCCCFILWNAISRCFWSCLQSFAFDTFWFRKNCTQESKRSHHSRHLTWCFTTPTNIKEELQTILIFWSKPAEGINIRDTIIIIETWSGIALNFTIQNYGTSINNPFTKMISDIIGKVRLVEIKKC